MLSSQAGLLRAPPVARVVEALLHVDDHQSAVVACRLMPRIALQHMARRRLEGLERVLGVNALFSTAYGNVGSSIYYALGPRRVLRARA